MSPHVPGLCPDVGHVGLNPKPSRGCPPTPQVTVLMWDTWVTNPKPSCHGEPGAGAQADGTGGSKPSGEDGSFGLD